MKCPVCKINLRSLGSDWWGCDNKVCKIGKIRYKLPNTPKKPKWN